MNPNLLEIGVLAITGGAVICGGAVAAFGLSLWYRDTRMLALTSMIGAAIAYNVFVHRKEDKKEDKEQKNKDVKNQ